MNHEPEDPEQEHTAIRREEGETMSSTMVLTMAEQFPTPPSTTSILNSTATKTSDIAPPSANNATSRTSTPNPSSNCPSCDTHLPSIETSRSELRAAHARIADLESQLRVLNQKAAAAVDRWADYEDELSKLRRAASGGATGEGEEEIETPPPLPPKNDQDWGKRLSGGLLSNGTNRLSALLSRNKSSPNLHQQQSPRESPQRPRTAVSTARAPQHQPPGHDPEALLKALTREKSLRKEAEVRVAATSAEVEELSVSLFEQANEMVAEERRARARLEERVGELERRDKEKRKRLERLESAMSRIERVRKLLDETAPVETKEEVTELEKE